MTQVLLQEDVDTIRVLTLNRPHARNALSAELVRALYNALVTADADDAVQVVVVTGADPAFCAGVDLKEAARDGEAYFRMFDTTDCVNQVGHVGKPVIGAVNGAAFTGGLELALGCDFLVASDRAVFADTHARVGVLPGGGMTARLPLVVGSGVARRMSMTGEVLDAAAALRVGLVTEVVPHARLRERALELAHAVADVPGPTMRGLKQIYVDGAATTVAPALAVERRVGAALAPDWDALEERRVAVMARNREQLAE
jgi:enoyl-CoA hydratase/carnithine racemase